MNYIEDLEKCLSIVEESLIKFEDFYRKGWYTAASFEKMRIENTLKSMKFCIRCAKKSAIKAEILPSKFKCVGGCIKPGIAERFKKCNKGLWFVFNLTRLKDKRYDPETDLFLGNPTDFWEELENENTEK